MTSIDISADPSGLISTDLLPSLDRQPSPGEPALVVDLLDQALALAPDVVNLHTSLARCLLERGNVRDARRHLLRALELDPLATETRCRLAAILVHEGEIPAALALYRSEQATGTSVRVQTEYADLLARLGLCEQAEAEYTDALGSSREYAPALVNLGIVHIRRGEPVSAAACFSRAAVLDPTCTEATLNLANAYVELGRLDEADELFLGLEGDAPLQGAARLGRSAIATIRKDTELARTLRREAELADRSLAGICGASGA